jgi:multidrug resistance efflux pump
LKAAAETIRKELEYLQAQLKQMNASIDSERGKLQRRN